MIALLTPASSIDYLVTKQPFYVTRTII